ncbi:MOSC domain-containing protein [Virgibacillus sp. W0181]|uniref:MOSC domain-containing protein n=1 Tax=Virgibacillus sp. W0181 TaxID=3391581 RepID=UPI003F4853CA
MLIGSIKEITRHPVKSFKGEKVDKTQVMKYGLYGDRSHAFLDKSRPGKFLTITQVPGMINYDAKFIGNETMNIYPKLEITSPSGRRYNWEDQGLQSELEELSNREIEPIAYSPDNVPIGPIEEDHLLIITDASLARLREMWGEQIDYRRFRPNLYIELSEKRPFSEDNWIGKEVQIGENVKIKINGHCERCMIITVNPDSGERSPSLLKTVVKERKNRFGVLASVEKTGDIHVGDNVYITNN